MNENRNENPIIIFGLGSNLGDRELNLQSGLEGLLERFVEYFTLIKSSSIYVTPALLPENSPSSWDIEFYNMAVSFSIDKDKEDNIDNSILRIIRGIECDIGRKKRRRWAPREIDIDILIISNQTIETAELSVPHKLLLDRDFALLPAAEIVEDVIYNGDEAEFHNMTLRQICDKKKYHLPKIICEAKTLKSLAY